MKVIYQYYPPIVPERDRYCEGVDYVKLKFDFGFDQTIYLLKELKNYRSTLFVQPPESSLHYYVDRDLSLRVEIDTITGFWADSEIDLASAQEILRIACACGEFGACVPNTDRVWDAYSTVD